MIYIITFLLSVGIAFYLQKRRYSPWWLILAIVPLVFLAAYRSIEIGRDTHYTYDWFRICVESATMRRPLEKAGKSELFVAVQFYISRLTYDFNLSLIPIYIITYGSILLSFLRVKKYGLVAVGLIVYLLFFHRESFNALRQVMAIGLCMISFTYLIESKYIKSLIPLPFAYGFHHSAYIFLIVILLKLFTDKYRRIANKKWLKILFFILSAVAVMSFQTIAIYMGGLGVIEDGYIEGYTNAQHFGTNLPISVLTMNIVNLLVFLYLPHHYKLIVKNNTFFQNILIIAFLCSFLGLVSTFAVRIGGYFWGMAPIIMMMLFDKKNRKSWFFEGYLFFTFLYWFLTVIVAKLGDIYPYKSVIFD